MKEKDNTQLKMAKCFTSLIITYEDDNQNTIKKNIIEVTKNSEINFSLKLNGGAVAIIQEKEQQDNNNQEQQDNNNQEQQDNNNQEQQDNNNKQAEEKIKQEETKNEVVEEVAEEKTKKKGRKTGSTTTRKPRKAKKAEAKDEEKA